MSEEPLTEEALKSLDNWLAHDHFNLTPELSRRLIAALREARGLPFGMVICMRCARAQAARACALCLDDSDKKIAILQQDLDAALTDLAEAMKALELCRESRLSRRFLRLIRQLFSR